ncbi:MAG TPA: glyoxylate/hydroxypyruvate reductase A [Pseudolabrys sp.]|nr:glyoxylate/hydroxypyruvate reductase A [Pseudolabrys sp.]
MALLITPYFGTPELWRRELDVLMPGLDVRFWPDVGDPADIESVALVALPPGTLRTFPNLRLIISLTAGIDSLMRDSDLPDVPIVRAADPAGDAMMNESALLHVLRHHRGMPAYVRAQARREWKRQPVRRADERSVGVMGLGSVGLACAETIASLGFKVAGWVRSPRQAGGIEIFAGPEQLHAFLARSEILLNLLPLTPETRGIINAETLRRLPAGASVINLGRGEHVVEADLMAVLDSGHLAAATLDVFHQEPLPSDSPLWVHPKITIMPHVARRLDASILAPRVCAILNDFDAGKPLDQQVDRGRGY